MNRATDTPSGRRPKAAAAAPALFLASSAMLVNAGFGMEFPSGVGVIQLAGGQYCIPSGNPIVREKYAPNRGSAAHFCTTLHRIDMLQRQKTHQTQTFAALQQGINVVFAHKSHATRCKTSCKVDFLAHSP
jgi:hypothetical protein